MSGGGYTKTPDLVNKFEKPKNKRIRGFGMHV